MTTGDTPFVAAIAAAPADCLPRLIYADFLGEHGRPAEADWLRTDVRLHLGESADRQADLRRLLHLPGPAGVSSLTLQPVFDAIAAIGRGVPVLGAAFQLAAATLQRAARAISRLERAAR
jgi:uncharacterized protein (TIGR02996 family)